MLKKTKKAMLKKTRKNRLLKDKMTKFNFSKKVFNGGMTGKSKKSAKWSREAAEEDEEEEEEVTLKPKYDILDENAKLPFEMDDSRKKILSGARGREVEYINEYFETLRLLLPNDVGSHIPSYITGKGDDGGGEDVDVNRHKWSICISVTPSKSVTFS